MPLVEIKYINALIDDKPFFHQPEKTSNKQIKMLLKMSRNDDYMA